MYRDDFVPVSPRSRFRDQLTAIGRHIETAMGRPFFLVDAVLSGRFEQMHVVAGTPPEVERITWERAADALQDEFVVIGAAICDG